MSTYEASRQFLQKESSDGVSLYNHLANVLLKVCQVLVVTLNIGTKIATVRELASRRKSLSKAE